MELAKKKLEKEGIFYENKILEPFKLHMNYYDVELNNYSENYEHFNLNIYDVLMKDIIKIMNELNLIYRKLRKQNLIKYN